MGIDRDNSRKRQRNLQDPNYFTNRYKQRN